MVKFLSSNQITASHYHRKDHRVCKINVVNRISSLESAARRIALSNFDINVQCAIHNICRRRLLANSWMLKVFVFTYLWLECPFKIKIMPLISMCKSTKEDWEDASIRNRSIVYIKVHYINIKIGDLYAWCQTQTWQGLCKYKVKNGF